jgi:hypothetical protein
VKGYEGCVGEGGVNVRVGALEWTRIPPDLSYWTEFLRSGVDVSGATKLRYAEACAVLRARLGSLPRGHMRSAGLRLLWKRAVLPAGRPLLRPHLLRRRSGVLKIRLHSRQRGGLRRILLQSRNEVRQRLADVHRQ